MEKVDPTIRNTEKRIWHLILMSVAVILYLTLGILSLKFSGYWPSSTEGDIAPTFINYVIALSILILLFCAYVIYQQRNLLSFSRTFSIERKTRETLSRNVEVLRALLEVSSGINSQKDLPDILDTITQEMLTCFRADHSSIMLLDHRSKILATKASFGTGAEYAQDALIPLGKSIAGWVAANSQPLLLNGQVDISAFPGATQKERTISSSLCVPLKMAEKNVGVLNVNLVDRDWTFSEDDLKLLTIFANNAAVAIHNSLLLQEKERRIRLQTMLGQLHSPQIVAQLVDKIEDGQRPNVIREKVKLTILFSDIRGFSDMLNVAQAEDIMAFLDEFYNVMNKAVFDNEGSIDKFIGDEVMAFFGAPIALENPTDNGLRTAREMVTYFQELRYKFAKRSPAFARLGLGVGMNTGEVFVGNVGSKTRYEYTVIGTAVNLARRLCASAKGDQILTTKETLKHISYSVGATHVGDMAFKGIRDKVHVHVIDMRRRKKGAA
ncbi:GAF domain-containing protein [Desulfatibacillum alkenivorans DSM 16219]|jgi:adenylate cyclase|uniref:GAF domain-containing protein n=1 Tax=Desulfatibacillum alkenivorans DSM 16219 TaxID=1121393 RepID=A0A1M6MTQ7_9BACT|nr:adenylate/guanylate cyclase domain-containing protein [Desulfatibacillum alkenivorans]SHJ86643.1 GAF domain-containing protein [Desulfatibacillum alkenivorans DSM 16219]